MSKGNLREQAPMLVRWLQENLDESLGVILILEDDGEIAHVTNVDDRDVESLLDRAKASILKMIREGEKSDV